MLSLIRSKNGQSDVHDVTVSLISCTNLKVSKEAVTTSDKGVENMNLYASFISNNEVIPVTVDDIAGKKLIISKPLMRHASDTTALWGNDKKAFTAARFSHNIPRKKSKSNDLLVLIGLMIGDESFPFATASLPIDTNMVDCILTLPVEDIPAEPTQTKKSRRPFSFMKRKQKDEPNQPMLVNDLGLQSSAAHGAVLNLRVQVKGTEMSNTDNDNFVVDSRHDFDTEEKSSDDNHDELRTKEQTDDDLNPVQDFDTDDFTESETLVTFASRQVPIQHQRTIIEKVLRGFSCIDVSDCPFVDVEESNQKPVPEQESAGKWPRETLDQDVESDLKQLVENVRNEFELGRKRNQRSTYASESYEDESNDASRTVEATTVGTYGTQTVYEDATTDGTVGSTILDIDTYMVGLRLLQAYKENHVKSHAVMSTDKDEGADRGSEEESRDDTFSTFNWTHSDQSTFEGEMFFCG